MFDLFSDLSIHFERYFILNEYSIHIIQWCVLGLFVLFMTREHRHFMACHHTNLRIK